MSSIAFLTQFYAHATPTPLEVITDSAIEDQIKAWRSESFGFLMTALQNESEVEKAAARQILLGKDWEIESRDFYGDCGRIEEEPVAVVYTRYESTGRKVAWIRLWLDDLRNELRHLTRLGEKELAAEFSHLIAQIDDTPNRREDRAYPARSAGNFAKIA